MAVAGVTVTNFGTDAAEAVPMVAHGDVHTHRTLDHFRVRPPLIAAAAGPYPR